MADALPVKIAMMRHDCSFAYFEKQGVDVGEGRGVDDILRLDAVNLNVAGKKG